MYDIIISIGNDVISLQGLLVSFVGEIFFISGFYSNFMVFGELCIGFTVNIFRDLLWNLHVGGLVLI